MISFEPFYQTLKSKGISTYKLINEFNVSRSLLDRLKHNKPISTVTLNDLCTILNCKYDTVLNHTDLYEYKHGKMLMHFQFCFESIPNELTPAAMLRYYRQRKGLTTRQLAESVGIVPATLLMYEREKFPIPYPTALAFADILEIDRNLLFDDFARFIDYPYSNRLREVRKAYGLNQADFAEKAGISLSIYSKWESGSRQPSRKMYQQLVTTYPQINI